MDECTLTKLYIESIEAKKIGLKPQSKLEELYFNLGLGWGFLSMLIANFFFVQI